MGISNTPGNDSMAKVASKQGKNEWLKIIGELLDSHSEKQIGCTLLQFTMRVT